MKIALSGKGGAGKTTVAAAFSLMLARRGMKVIAVDADPDANLASALGVPLADQKNIPTIVSLESLIAERTGAQPGVYGQVFRLNPDVADIAETHSYRWNGLHLLTLGAVTTGGAGCACPENTFLRSLVQHLFLHENQHLIMDMEAGVEHLGRGTARGVDCLVIVVEPTQRSASSFLRIINMARDIDIQETAVIMNKIHTEEDASFLAGTIGNTPVIGSLPFSHNLMANDRDGISVLDGLDEYIFSELERSIDALLKKYG